jgi:hypothetical protein
MNYLTSLLHEITLPCSVKKFQKTVRKEKTAENLLNRIKTDYVVTCLKKPNYKHDATIWQVTLSDGKKFH